MKAGDTFRYSYGVHWWVVVSDPELDPDAVLVVNFTSNKRWQDQSCVLQPGEHPTVTIETIIFYAKAKIASNRDLEAELAAGRITLGNPVAPAVLARIREGARVSPRISFRNQQLLRDQGLI